LVREIGRGRDVEERSLEMTEVLQEGGRRWWIQDQEVLSGTRKIDESWNLTEHYKTKRSGKWWFTTQSYPSNQWQIWRPDKEDTSCSAGDTSIEDPHRNCSSMAQVWASVG